VVGRHEQIPAPTDGAGGLSSRVAHGQREDEEDIRMDMKICDALGFRQEVAELSPILRTRSRFRSSSSFDSWSGARPSPFL